MTDTERALSWWEDAKSRVRRADVVLVRYGDFWETFNDHALTLASKLCLTLAHRTIHGTSCALAGLPIVCQTSLQRAKANGLRLRFDDSAHCRYEDRGYAAYDEEQHP